MSSVPENDRALLEEQMLKLEGWCTPEKFRDMYDLVLKERPEVCIEIGVFGGRSLIAMLGGCRAINHGHVWGIDPYAAASGIEGYEAVLDKANYDWWAKIDYEAIYTECMRNIQRLGLAHWCTIVRETAKQAVSAFQTIDILHIDGNHTEEIAVSDVSLYAPLVKQGGYVWFDDINWPSTQKAVALLRQTCEEVSKRETYALYRKL